MASQKGQRKKATSQPSARLSISPGDEWRSWSKLSAEDEAAIAAPENEEDEDEEIDLDDLSRFSGSMIVVDPSASPAPPSAPAPPAAPVPAPEQPTPPAPDAEAEAKAQALAAAMTAKAEALAHAELVARAEAEARATAEARVAELQRSLAEAEARMAAAAEQARLEAAARAEAEAREEQARAARARAEADRIAAEQAGPKLPVRQRSAAPNRHTTGPLDLPPVGTSAEEQAVDDALVAFVLDSDPSAPHRPGTAHGSGGTALAAAPARTEISVTPGGSAGSTVDKTFEERVRVSFMQLVERIDRLEQSVSAPGPAASPGNLNAASVADDAIVTFLSQRQAEIAAAQDELTARQEELIAGQAKLRDDHKSLAAQHIQLAELGRSLVGEQSDTKDELAAALAKIAELSAAVERSVSAVPGFEARVVSLEREVAGNVRELAQQVSGLAEKFPAVEGAVEVAHRNIDAIAVLTTTAQQHGQRVDAELAALSEQIGKLDELQSGLEHVADLTQKTESEFQRLQAEVDRHTDSVESRLLELEDFVGNETGVDRQLLLDRIEELERGITELDPDRFAQAAELAELRRRLDELPTPAPRAEA